MSGALISWLSVGTQMKMAQGRIRFPQKPVSVKGCNPNWVAEYLSLTLSPESTPKPFEPTFMLYKLSYMYYTLLGSITAIVVGLIVSHLTGTNREKEIHMDLLSPVIYRFLKKRSGNKENNKNTTNNIVSSNNIQMSSVD